MSDQQERRKFIKSISTVMAGFAVVPAFASSNIEKRSPLNGKAVYIDDSSEAFWEQVKQEFVFADKLKYFNNGSLGSSPIIVQKATNEFRQTLDLFPSKYMWGGWEDEKEKTRHLLRRGRACAGRSFGTQG